MNEISLNFAKGELKANLPKDIPLSTVIPKPGLKLPLVEQIKLIKESLAKPIGKPRLSELALDRENAVVVVSDNTRLAPSNIILPPILEELKQGGISPNNTTILIGVGNHRPLTEDEKVQLVGLDVYKTYLCKHSKEGQYIRKGITSRGTPVEISQYAAEADLKILTGNIEIHRLAGYSGGGKGCVGISSPLALENNHRLMKLGSSVPTKLINNPVREDLNEYAEIIGTDYLLNVITDELGNIEYAFAGDFKKAHLEGVNLAKNKYYCAVDGKVDLAIASAGGAPKDSSLYQALKAVQNVMGILAKGGIAIVAASCKEGFGDDKFKEWIMQSWDTEEIINRGQREFVLGGHKAVMLANLLSKGQVFFVSEMDSAEVRKTGFRPFQNLQEAIDTALKQLGTPKIAVFPYAGVTFPYLIN